MPVRGLPNVTMHAKAKRGKRLPKKRPPEAAGKPKKPQPDPAEMPPWVRR